MAAPLLVIGVVAAIAWAGTYWLPSPVLVTPHLGVGPSTLRFWTVVVTVLLGVLVALPRVQARKVTSQRRTRRFEAENHARQTLFQVLAGAGLLLGIALTWAQFDHAIQTSAATIGLSREAQVTDRLTKAVEQLGSERAEQRVGAAFALERVASDSPRDKQAVLIILAAALRARAPWPTERIPTREDLVERQAIVTILGRLEDRSDLGGWQQYASWRDLRGTDLRYLTFSGGDYRHTDFSDSSFRGANLAFAKFDRSRFGRADLAEVFMFDADAIGAWFTDTILYCANLVKADLSRAMFERADLHGANLAITTLTETQFSGSNLRGVVLTDVSGTAASFSRSDLRGSSFGFDDVRQVATLYGSNLHGVFLHPALAERAAALGAILRPEPTERTVPSGSVACTVDLHGSRTGRPEIGLESSRDAQ